MHLQTRVHRPEGLNVECGESLRITTPVEMEERLKGRAGSWENRKHPGCLSATFRCIQGQGISVNARNGHQDCTRDGAVCALHKGVSWEWQGAWRLMSNLHSVCYSVSPKGCVHTKGSPFLFIRQEGVPFPNSHNGAV